MAITSSAKKALRSSKKKHLFNVARKTKVENVLRRIKKLVSEKNKAEAMKLVPEAYKFIDKAAKAHTIPKNTASRRKSRLMGLIQRIG